MTDRRTVHLALVIAADHPAFAGHFPGSPVVPGVVLLDHGLRSISAHLRRDSHAPWQIANVKFLSPVRPGEPLALEVSAAEDDLVRASRLALTVRAGREPTARIAMTGQVVARPE